MPERESSQDRYCRNCRAEIRGDTSFCVSCGVPLQESSEAAQRTDTSETRRSFIPQNVDFLHQPNTRLALLGVGAVLLLIVVVLLLRYSFVLTILILSILVSAALIFRKVQGSQTQVERQIFSRASQYKEFAQRSFEVGRGKYDRWREAQAAEQERADTLRALERERSARQSRLDQYKSFFGRAYKGSRASLDWWKAYQDDDDESAVSDLLKSAHDRAGMGLKRIRELENSMPNLLQRDLFGESDRLLDELKARQENLKGSNSVFSPLVEVHNNIKRLDEWKRYCQKLWIGP